MWVLFWSYFVAFGFLYSPFFVSHIENYSPHLLSYKPKAERVVYHQLITDGILLFQLQAYKAATRGSNFRCGIAKVFQGVRKQFSWDNKKVAHKNIFTIFLFLGSE